MEDLEKKIMTVASIEPFKIAPFSSQSTFSYFITIHQVIILTNLTAFCQLPPPQIQVWISNCLHTTWERWIQLSAYSQGYKINVIEWRWNLSILDHYLMFCKDVVCCMCIEYWKFIYILYIFISVKPKIFEPVCSKLPAWFSVVKWNRYHDMKKV